MRLDHVGIAVRSLDAAVQVYTLAFGARAVHREELPREHARLAFVDAGGVLLELLEPLGEEGPLARFLGSRGEGLHHVAFEVGDLTQAVQDLVAAGHHPVDPEPRRGSRGRLVMFLHPSTTHGVLIELVQA